MNDRSNSKKTALLVIFLLSQYFLVAQNSIMTIKDSKTKEAISSVYVSIYKQNQSFETISNTDGKFKVPIQFDSIKFSHIAYNALTIIERFKNEDVFLESKSVLLEDVKVYNLELKDKIAFVLKNFNRLYVNGPRTYQCTYKGSQRVNTKLSRLLQFNLKWWNKTYNSNLKKSVFAQNQLGIGETDYVQKGELDTGFGIDLTSFLSSLLLNNYLTGLYNSLDEIIIERIEKDSETSTVYFSAKNNGPRNNFQAKFSDCEVRFDLKTGAIVLLKTRQSYENRVDRGISQKTNAPYEIHYIDEQRLMSFVNEENKLRLAQYNININTEAIYQGRTNKYEDQVDIYVTKIEKGNMIPPKSFKIDLNSQNIFEHIGEKISDNPKILFTEEEIRFINTKVKDD